MCRAFFLSLSLPSIVSRVSASGAPYCFLRKVATRSVSRVSKRTSNACTTSRLRYSVMRAGTPAKTILASSQRRSAALLFHSSAWQRTLAKRFFTSTSLAPSPTPFASYAAADTLPVKHSKRRASSSFRIQLPPAKAAFLMIVHHTGRLHESVHDSRADEVEAALPQVLRQRLGARHSARPGKTP